MNGATANALRPAQARSVQRILRGLGALWDAPALANVGVVANPRLSRTLGRVVGRQLRIERPGGAPPAQKQAWTDNSRSHEERRAGPEPDDDTRRVPVLLP